MASFYTILQNAYRAGINQGYFAGLIRNLRERKVQMPARAPAPAEARMRESLGLGKIDVEQTEEIA